MIITDYSIVREYEKRLRKQRQIEKYKNRCFVLIVIILIEVCILFAIYPRYKQNNGTTVPEPTSPVVPLEDALPLVEDTAHVETSQYMQLSSKNKNEFATLVYLEAGIESYECKLAVASVVVNRMTMYGQTFNDVVYAPNQFSPAALIPYYEPTQECIDAVNEILQNGPSIPEYVTFFRADYYFDWGDRYRPYTCIDHTYFSYDVDLKAVWENNHVI